MLCRIKIKWVLMLTPKQDQQCRNWDIFDEELEWTASISCDRVGEVIDNEGVSIYTLRLAREPIVR